MFHCQIRSWFVQEWASHSSCESDGKHEFGDKSFPICFAPKAMSVWLPTKWDGSFSGQITIGASKPSCFIIFHHFSPCKKNMLNPYWFSKKRLCFKRELVTSYINLKIGLKYLERLKKKGSIPGLTWFKNLYLLKEPCHG
jgi:hypothetical protein